MLSTLSREIFKDVQILPNFFVNCHNFMGTGLREQAISQKHQSHKNIQLQKTCSSWRFSFHPVLQSVKTFFEYSQSREMHIIVQSLKSCLVHKIFNINRTNKCSFLKMYLEALDTDLFVSAGGCVCGKGSWSVGCHGRHCRLLWQFGSPGII